MTLPTRMKAVVYHGRGDLRVEDLPVPLPGVGEILVRVEACGICPTDLKKIEKGLLPGPRVFGHEIAGRIEALGEGVKRYAEGDRVVVHHHVPCGRCFYCAHKAYAQCPVYKQNGTTAGFEPSGGGYAEYVLARDWIVEQGTIPVPEGVAPEEAAFVEPVNTCLKAARKAAIEPDETVLVVGLGPIGLLLMQIARALGARTFASDPLPERRELAEKLGAGRVLDSAADVAAEVQSLSAGRGADCVLVAAPGQAAFDQAVLATRPGGRLLSFAATAPGETVNVDLGMLTNLEKDLLTAYSSSIELQQEAAELVFSRRVRTADLVSHRLPVARGLEAFALASGRAPGTLKVVLSASAS
jgi:L-iditol 2-dehydrogenase